MAHRNAEAIKAWADGHEIQYNAHGVWYTYSFSAQSGDLGPWGDVYFEWRVAPKKVLIRHAMCDGKIVTLLKNYSTKEDAVALELQTRPGLLWLDDWHEASFGPLSKDV